MNFTFIIMNIIMFTFIIVSVKEQFVFFVHLALSIEEKEAIDTVSVVCSSVKLGKVNQKAHAEVGRPASMSFI